MTMCFFAKPDEANTQDLETFFNNFDLIQQHKQLIFDIPEYYKVRIAGLGCFPLYTPPILSHFSHKINHFSKIII